ncbi:hypothetical protein [Armatimonas rosea]|uniref:Uncharacterized protein n=1 Tax=Armatimonas rosea TaxID=685828 RepID=A0A7W9SRW9_ARMRO|nr:hypothetical protein [Armatimonas rosea]MBB6050864.1 hypothetical protein [Armatimonas rosea]
MTEREEDIDDYLDALVRCDNAPLRQELREKLIALGAEAVPRLLELLAWEHPVIYDIRLILLEQPSGAVLEVVLDRLARLELTGREPADLLILAQTKPELDFFRAVLTKVVQSPSYDDLPALLRILEGAYKSKLAQVYLGAEARLAAQGVLRLAEAEPRPELRAALPLLRSINHRWAVSPLELVSARLRLVRLLRKIDSLPIPAEAGKGTENLPLSAQKPCSTEDAACRGE